VAGFFYGEIEMKKSLLLALMVMGFAGHALSSEVYTANVTAKDNKSRDRVYRFELAFATEGEQVSGQFVSYDSTKCGKDRKITGTLKGDVLQVRSEESEVQGCGRLNFTGKKEADGSIVGKMQFQGEQREFVFKK
jgi:hypothetical protein